MRHHKTYMYINVQQNQVNRSIITVLTILLAKNCKLHKFATTSSNIEKNRLIETCVIVTRTCISFFKAKLGY